MRKIIYYLLFLIIILIGLLINVFIWRFAWDYETVPSADEARHVDRSIAIINGDATLFTRFPESDVPDYYPSGFHVFIVLFLQITGMDIFSSILLLEIFTYILILCSYYIVGAMFSREIGILSMLFKVITPKIIYHLNSNFVYPQLTYFSTGSITEIFILFSFFCIMKIYVTRNNDPFFYCSLILVLLFSTIIHGLSHISTYVSSLFFIIFGNIVLYFLFYKVNDGRNSNFSIIINLVMCISIPMVFFIYYYNALLIGIPDNLYPPEELSLIGEKYYPVIFQLSIPLFILSICILVMIFFYIVNNKHLGKNVMTLGFNEFTILIPFVYIGLYVLSIILITDNPLNYSHGEYVETFFPTYLNYIDRLSLISVVFGLMFFCLSILGLVALRKKLTTKNNLLLYIYLIFFFLFTINYLLMKYFSSRFLTYIYLIPVIEAFGFLYFGKTMLSKITRPLLNNFLLFLVIGILISSQIVIQQSKEPFIRNEEEPNFMFGIEQTTHPTGVTPKSEIVLNRYIEKNSTIFGSVKTLESIYLVMDYNIPPYHYISERQYYHAQYIAATDGRDYQMFITYNISYAIITNSDGREINEQKYSNNSQIHNIYSDDTLRLYLIFA